MTFKTRTQTAMTDKTMIKLKWHSLLLCLTVYVLQAFCQYRERHEKNSEGNCAFKNTKKCKLDIIL